MLSRAVLYSPRKKGPFHFIQRRPKGKSAFCSRALFSTVCEREASWQRSGAASTRQEKVRRTIVHLNSQQTATVCDVSDPGFVMGVCFAVTSRSALRIRKGED